MSRITAAARDQPCTIQIPGACNGNPETTVFCHSNKSIHGKGVGKKSHDLFGAFGCTGCHDVYDRRRKPPDGMPYAEVEEYFQNGADRTKLILIGKGLITCK